MLPCNDFVSVVYVVTACRVRTYVTKSNCMQQLSSCRLSSSRVAATVRHGPTTFEHRAVPYQEAHV